MVPHQLEQLNPEPPAPVQLADETWEACQTPKGPRLCITAADAEALMRDRAELARWAAGASNLIRFYRGEE